MSAGLEITVCTCGRILDLFYPNRPRVFKNNIIPLLLGIMVTYFTKGYASPYWIVMKYTSLFRF